MTDYGKIFKELVGKEGYELLSEYKNSSSKVNIKCPLGHEYKVSPHDFKKGRRCSKCAGHCPIQAKEQFLELLENEGYELLSEYKNTRYKVKLKCNKGHIYKIAPYSFKVGKRCIKCSNVCPNRAKEIFIKELINNGYIILSKYINSKSKVLVECPNKHKWEITPNNFVSKYHRCPHCKGSTGQRLLQKMLEERNIGEIIYNSRKILNGLELDIYYPELSIGIEYQGNYWHNLPKTKERDKRKKLLCKERGIKLIEVWDDEFLMNAENVIINLLKEICLSYESRICE